MERDELLEWLGLIAVILAWWPPLFLNWFPLAYKLGVILFSLAVIGVVTVRRVRRFRESLRIHREMMGLQKPSGPPPPSGRDKRE